MEDIKDKIKAVFEACGKTAKDKADKVNEVDKTELPKLSAKEVARIGLPTVFTIWEPIAAIPKLDLEVVNFPEELIFAAQYAGEPINGFSVGVKPINLPT